MLERLAAENERPAAVHDALGALGDNLESAQPPIMKKIASMSVVPSFEIHGHVAKGFEAVREAFLENFARRNELGAACCVYRHGEKVVDLWGGIRNKATGEPWEADTMAFGQKIGTK